MHTLEITIQRKGETGWPVVVEQTRPGTFLPVRREGSLTLDEATERQLTTYEYVDPQKYGTALGKALFRENVRDALKEARAQDDGDLRVLLVVEAPDLIGYRWERLCAPIGTGGSWTFLTQDQRAPFSRYLPSLTDRRFPAIGKQDLRALVVVANPPEGHQLARFDEAELVAGIKAALGDIPHDLLASTDGASGPPTLGELVDRISGERYTLLHVVAHGAVTGSGGTVLYLLNEAGQVEPVTGERFINRLQQTEGALGLPHLAFLATCESASPEAETALGGLGQTLVRELGMPAVVAMTDRVSIPTATALAEGFYARLQEDGEVDRVLVQASAKLAEKHDATVPALFSRLGGRPLWSDSLDRKLKNSDIEDGLELVEAELPRRAPVLQEQFAEQARTLRRTLIVDDPAALSASARREREEALRKLNELCEEVFELTFNAVAFGQEPPEYDDRCPFRGMAAFRAEDRQFFFGRGTLVNRLVQRLDRHPFLAITGPSGSGKSSLVLAGLIPTLQERTPDLQPLYMTPGGEPVARLESTLAPADHSLPALLIVDQFEELFTYDSTVQNRETFLDRLLSLTTDMPVVLTMRADFWGECASYTRLKDEMQDHHELIGPMTTAELRSAMEDQAGIVGLRFEADLSHTILDSVKDEPGAMPLLQHTLLELWRRRHGRWLLAKEYRALGGVREAIARTAERIYMDLSETAQRRARDIFLRLTRLDEDGGAGERRDTRRRVRLSELVPAGSKPTATKALVERLADARLVVTTYDEAAGDVQVEVAHEALIRHWPRLREWLDQDLLNIRLRTSIARAAREWHEGERNENLLPRWNSQLEAALELADQPHMTLNKLEQAYLDACVALRDRETAEKERRAKELEKALEEAVAAREQAEREARRAKAGELAARARMVLERSEETSESLPLLLAREAVSLTVRASEPVVFSANLALLEAVMKASPHRLTLAGHERAVNSAAYSPDGTRIVTASHDRTVRVWDAVNGKLLLTVSDHKDSARSAMYSPDGTRIVTACSDGMVRVWNASSGELLLTLGGNRGWVRSATFSPDGAYITAADASGTARVWDATSGKLVLTLSGHGNAVTSASYSPDGTCIVTASLDRTLRIWNAMNGECILALNGHEGAVTSASYSPDGTCIVSASYDGTALIWDVKNEKPLLRLAGHKGPVFSAAYSPRGDRIITSGRDGTARVYHTTTGKLLLNLTDHNNAVFSAQYSPNGAHIITASPDGTARVWDAAEHSPLLKLNSDDKVVFSAAYSPDGNLIVTGEREGRARVWDTTNGEPLLTLSGHENSVTSANFSSDCSRIVTGSDDRTARIWDATSGEHLLTLSGHEGWIRSATFAPDGARIVTASDDRSVCVWNALSGELLLTFKGHNGWVRSASFSPDGACVATGSYDRTARVWDATTGEHMFTLSGHDDAVTSSSYTHDGACILTTSLDGRVRIWDAITGECQFALGDYDDPIWSGSYSFDDSRIVTSGSDGMARVWNAASGELVLTLSGHEDWVYSAQHSPDGAHIVTASRDGTAFVWPATIEAWLQIAEQRIQRDPPEFTLEERKRFGLE